MMKQLSLTISLSEACLDITLRISEWTPPATSASARSTGVQGETDKMIRLFKSVTIPYLQGLPRE